MSIINRLMPLCPNQDNDFQWIFVHHISQEYLHSPSIHHFIGSSCLEPHLLKGTQEEMHVL